MATNVRVLLCQTSIYWARTLKEALYGMPIGRFAKTARARFAAGDLEAKLWLIS
jgi:hypothetical protein